MFGFKRDFSPGNLISICVSHTSPHRVYLCLISISRTWHCGHRHRVYLQKQGAALVIYQLFAFYKKQFAAVWKELHTHTYISTLAESQSHASVFPSRRAVLCSEMRKLLLVMCLLRATRAFFLGRELLPLLCSARNGGRERRTDV